MRRSYNSSAFMSLPNNVIKGGFTVSRRDCFFSGKNEQFPEFLRI